MLNYLTDLCAMNGVSSFEDSVRAFIRAKAELYATEIRVDAMGNLIVFKKGAKTTGNRLMLTAHMDEVGF
ncbi:MAG: M42 family peptidase, partial [Pseudoflavonifractor sp.]